STRTAIYALVLMSLFSVARATAQDVTGTDLLITGAGPHAIGGTTSTGQQLGLLGTFSGNAANANVFGLEIGPTLNIAVSQDAALLNLDGTLVEAGSSAHGLRAGLRVNPQFTHSSGASTMDVAGIWINGLTANTGTINASGLKIAGAPTGATNNYAMWVDAGESRFDGPVVVTSAGPHAIGG